jgi:hypothetical protein
VILAGLLSCQGLLTKKVVSATPPGEGIFMSTKLTAVIKKESKTGPETPKQTNYYAALQLFSEEGKEYGVPRYFSGFLEVERLIEREGVPHELSQVRHVAYQRGEEIRILLTVENEDAIGKLGFNPRAAA